MAIEQVVSSDLLLAVDPDTGSQALYVDGKLKTEESGALYAVDILQSLGLVHRSEITAVGSWPQKADELTFEKGE